MKIYHLKQGIGVEYGGKFHLLQNESWDTLINRDDALAVVSSLLQPATEIARIDERDILSPMGQRQELWGCGAIYRSNRDVRQEETRESGAAVLYARVYEAERPEIFFKATAHRVVGHTGFVRVREDSVRNVPEPELTLVVTSNRKIIGYTIGNDMSSWSIESENPLYLAQAKVYDGCAALGPCIYLTDESLSDTTEITIEVRRKSVDIFKGAIALNQMKRTPEELVSWVFRECSFPYGCFIMTGTGIVAPTDFSLKSGDGIGISIPPIGKLINIVR